MNITDGLDRPLLDCSTISTAVSQDPDLIHFSKQIMKSTLNKAHRSLPDLFWETVYVIGCPNRPPTPARKARPSDNNCIQSSSPPGNLRLKDQ